MDPDKKKAILMYAASACFYIAAILAHKSSTFPMWLCLGSTMLLFGASAMLRANRAEEENPSEQTDSTPQEPEDASAAEPQSEEQ